MPNFRDTHFRSVTKALSWRIVGTLVTTALVYVLTGRGSIALTVGAAEFILKVFVYWLHERAWDRISFGQRQISGGVIWLTGFPAAGKTSVAAYISAELKRRGYTTEHLDGDQLRAELELGQGAFSKEERDQHVIRTGHLAGMLEKQGVWVVVSLISPYLAARSKAKQFCRHFVEVHVSTPLSECERRDPKGLYALARSGAFDGLTGVTSPYESPVQPDIVIDTTGLSPVEAGSIVLKKLNLA